MSGSGPNTRLDQPSLSSASASLPGSLETILRAQGQTPKKGNGKGRGLVKGQLQSREQGTEIRPACVPVYVCERLRG